MRHRATPLLHVLACAPVAALAAAAIALPVHALAAPPPSPAPRTTAPAKPPAPYVVAIDPGHGGTPDNNNPGQLFDPGVIAANGLQEKDLTLDVAKRLAALLRADNVEVVLTRTDDSYVDIGPRMQTAIDAGAQLFVSIHFNSWTDPTTGGALVLYPNDGSLQFAQTMSESLANGLQNYGVGDDGVQSKPDLWVHATMPTVTVEGAYLTNTREAALLTQNDFRDALARSIRIGVETQAPEIATLNAQITAWRVAHPAPRHAANNGSSGATLGTSSGSVPQGVTFGGVLRWLIFLSLLAALIRWRRRVAPLVLSAYTAAGERFGHPARRRLRNRSLTLATSWKPDTLLIRPMSTSQRRRRSARRRAVLQRAARPAPTRRSVYDELWF